MNQSTNRYIFGVPSWVFALAIMLITLVMMMLLFTWMYRKGMERSRENPEIQANRQPYSGGIQQSPRPLFVSKKG